VSAACRMAPNVSVHLSHAWSLVAHQLHTCTKYSELFPPRAQIQLHGRILDMVRGSQEAPSLDPVQQAIMQGFTQTSPAVSR